MLEITTNQMVGGDHGKMIGGEKTAEMIIEEKIGT